MNNFVAKHCRAFNKATVQRDKTKFHRPSNNDLLAEWYEQEAEDEDWFAPTNKETETPSISL